jgi:CRP/FNR family transcriptional regulator
MERTTMPSPQEAVAQDGFAFLDVAGSPLRVKRGHSLFHAGDPFTAIYAIRFGSFKTCIIDREGRQQVMGFNMQGDVLGLDGIASGRHDVGAVALEDSEVLALPFAAVERAARDDPGVQHRLGVLLAREIVQDHGAMMILGSLRADERVAAFLLALSRKFQRLGYSPSDFHLRMTRADIGSYLGLKIETVSRTFTTLGNAGLIEVSSKHVRLVDVDGIDRRYKGLRGAADAQPTRARRVLEQAQAATADARSGRQRSVAARGLSLWMRRQRGRASGT